jgi:formate dehydrogenase alpha subunit
MLEYVPTICPYCGSGCGMYLVIKDGRIQGVETWKEHPVNEGTNCPKGRHALDFLYHPDRLTYPLVKTKDKLKKASWEEALEKVAEGFKGVDPKEFGVLASGKNTNEDAYVLQKFARVVMKTNNVEYCARYCHSATVAGLLPTVGSGVMETSQLDIPLADCIIIFGVNIKETFPMISKRVIEAKKKGAKVIVVDPRNTLTARLLGDIHLQVRSGSDVALANAMMAIILAEGLENKKFIEERTADFDELKKHLESFDLSEAEKVTGVPLEKIKEAALAYARAERGCILYDQGITQHTSGGDNVASLADLALLTGHIGKPGSGVNPMRGQINGEGSGDMGCVNVFYPGFKNVGPDAVKFFEDAWQVEGLPGEPGLTLTDLVHKCRVLYAVGMNPMMASPDVNEIEKSLKAKDFLVVQDIFPTQIAQLADVVLPAATWVEREGVHAWVDRRVQKINKVIDPPGEAKPDWQITCQIAEKMGFKKHFDFKSSGEIFEEIRKVVPQYKGLTYERIENTAGGIHWPCPAEDHPGTPTMFGQKFGTPDGLGHFKVVNWKPPAELPDKDFPLTLITGRNLFHYHSGSMSFRTEALLSEVPEAYAQINPEDAARLEIENADPVILKTRRGKIKVKARVTDDVPVGTVFVPFHFSKAPANILTNPALDPGCKMPEFKVCAVRVEGGR